MTLASPGDTGGLLLLRGFVETTSRRGFASHTFDMSDGGVRTRRATGAGGAMDVRSTH
jgi:hypothetical protein